MSSLDNLTQAANENAQIAKDLSSAVDRAIIALDAGGTNNDVRLTALAAQVNAATAAVTVERDRLSVATAAQPQPDNSGVPVLTSPIAVVGRVGQPFRHQLTASNRPTSYTASSLPQGLRLDASSGVISGTPSDDGSTNVSVGLVNARGTGRADIGIAIR